MTTSDQFSLNVAHSYHNNPKQNKVSYSHFGYIGHTMLQDTWVSTWVQAQDKD